MADQKKMGQPQNHFLALYELCNAVGVVGLGDFYDFNLTIATGRGGITVFYSILGLSFFSVRPIVMIFVVRVDIGKTNGGVRKAVRRSREKERKPR